MVKYLLAALLSAALIQAHGGSTPAKLNNSVMHVRNVRAVQAATTEKVEQKAPTNPQPVTEPEPVTPTYPVGCASYEPIVAQYSWDVRTAMAIMRAESGCNPNAISPAALNYDGCSDFGLMQIHCNDTLDPNANIAIAYHKYQTQGWQAWSTYNSGAIWRYY